MKYRCSKTEVQFYVKRLETLGYKRVSCDRTSFTFKIVLQKGSDFKTVKYSNNGWISIY